MFSCPDLLVPARLVFGPHGLELQGNGSHRVTAGEGELVVETRGLCLSLDERNNNISAELYFCYSEDTPSEKIAIDIIYIICIFLSCIFFLITFLVYLFLAQLRENFFGKLMMAFLMNVCLNFLLNGIKRCLDFVYGEEILLTPICYFLGYSIHHTFISFFIWMNVMAINFTYKFSNVMRRPSSSIDHTKRNIFLTCLYGQGIPALITLVIALLDTTGDCSEVLPNIARHDCFPSSGLYGQTSLPFHRTSQFLYFYLVIIVIILINMACFLITGFHLTRHSFNLASFNAKQMEILNHIRLVLNISVVMGVPWCLEIISASLKNGGLDQISSQRIELALDFVNILAVNIYLITITFASTFSGSFNICNSDLQEKCD